MKKTLKHTLFFILVAALAIWVYHKVNQLPSLSDLFTPKKTEIENTPVMVKQIQALAQLITVSMYEEIVVDSNATESKTLHIPLLPDISVMSEEKKLVLIGKVTANVGIDLQKLSNLDISGTKDSIHILLPAAEVLDAIVNPSDVSVFIERGRLG